jgi:hypothetical protein
MTYTSLRDLTIKDFITITNILETFKDDVNRINKELIKYFNLEKSSISETENILLNINNILSQKPDFIQRFTLDGVEYGFIPNLDNITTGEWIDIEEYQKDINNADKLVSILYRPIKRSFKFWRKDYYNIEEYNGSNNKLKDAPLEVYLGSLIFFYHLGKSLLNHLDTCTKNLTMKEKQIVTDLVQKHNSNKSLDGIV